ncbi:hypothetical protein SAOR_02940 [Salinisphaera orenii MK-B5]|uniref:Ribosome association toxin RatA n=1 Tax=Salinisphaera orenii MK-B5 TaxID=856730 RepID=A0A423PW16_9GAMM|nr:SRPBCC family protein [Salinisphaera orenii]ROO29765.1 hypothetical protein SAOR_02940 [Salinisphaera orenii MK-B5]
MDVTRDAGRYAVDAVIMLNVPPGIAFRAATDYERLPEFNPSIERSERLGDDRLRSDVRLCVAFFCRTIEQVMTYRERAPTRIDMQVVPDAGDLETGHAAWRFEAAEAGTWMAFRAEIEPAFWVPPVIGPYLISRELRAQARTTAEAIERLGADYQAGAGDD